MALHYGRDDFAEPEQLARSLSREGAKDTTLNYDRPEGREPDEDLVRRYAERRGLAPESQIIVRAPTQERAAERPAPKRGKFAGLKLDASRTLAASRQAERTAPQAEPAPARALTEQERQQRRLEGAVADFARAWSAAERMRRRDLPVLPHQEKALETAKRALEAFDPNAGRDVRVALETDPGLARGIEIREGRQALTQAAAAVRRDRLVLEEQGRATVRHGTRWSANTRPPARRTMGRAARDRHPHGGIHQGAETRPAARQPVAHARAGAGHRRRFAARPGGAGARDRPGADPLHRPRAWAATQPRPWAGNVTLGWWAAEQPPRGRGGRSPGRGGGTGVRGAALGGGGAAARDRAGLSPSAADPGRARRAGLQPDAGAIAQELRAVGKRLDGIEGHPALTLTPDAYANQAAAGVRRLGDEAGRSLTHAQGRLSDALHEMRGLIGSAHDQFAQQRRDWIAVAIGALVELALWYPLVWLTPFGGGTWLAATLIGGGRWQAGESLMQEANPEQWERMARLYKACLHDSTTELCEAAWQ